MQSSVLTTSDLDAATLQREAEKCIAGGVVSLNRKVNPSIVFQRASGCRLTGRDGTTYIDYHAAFAPFLLGHNHPIVNEAVLQAMRKQWSLMGSGTTEWEVELARRICAAVPSVELVQLTNTGSEATALAIRLARAYTKRDETVLVLGGYNGWHDEVARLVGPPLELIGPRCRGGTYPFLPSSAGIPRSTQERIHVVGFNDEEALERVLRTRPIACVLTEPVLQNVGVILPQPGFLERIIALCEHHGALCIFDEVKTGFRSAFGGYQSVAGVRPHLSVFGKAVANGYPLGVVGGRKDIVGLFDAKDPASRVLIAGTYNAHPFNAAAAIATLEILREGSVYESIDRQCGVLYDGLLALCREKGLNVSLASNRSAFCLYFMDHPPVDWHDVLEHHDFELDVRLRNELIRRGIYHIPLACKQGSVSAAHGSEDIAQTLEATCEALRAL